MSIRSWVVEGKRREMVRGLAEDGAEPNPVDRVAASIRAQETAARKVPGWTNGFIHLQEPAETLLVSVPLGPYVLGTLTKLAQAWGVSLPDVLEEVLVAGCEALEQVAPP